MKRFAGIFLLLLLVAISTSNTQLSPFGLNSPCIAVHSKFSAKAVENAEQKRGRPLNHNSQSQRRVFVPKTRPRRVLPHASPGCIL